MQNFSFSSGRSGAPRRVVSCLSRNIRFFLKSVFEEQFRGVWKKICEFDEESVYRGKNERNEKPSIMSAKGWYMCGINELESRRGWMENKGSVPTKQTISILLYFLDFSSFFRQVRLVSSVFDVSFSLPPPPSSSRSPACTPAIAL